LAVIVGLAVLCYTVISPFLNLTVWSIILAVTLYPLHQKLAKMLWGKQWLSSVLIVIFGCALIITPTAMLLSSFADSVRGFITQVQEGTLQIPAPSPSVETWPLVGRKISAYWTQAYTDLPGFVQKMQPKISEMAQKALSMVASIGTSLLLFLVSFIVSGILMAYGESGHRTFTNLFVRIAGKERGEALTVLSVATIRSVALGVLGIAFVQAVIVGLAMMFAGIPAAGILAVIVLVLGIAQVPALVVSLPAIAYIWASGSYTTSSALLHTVILLIAGMADNVLKPIMLGRGVDVPMPVILFGALGGMATGGIQGMFVGATVLAIGYSIFMNWLSIGTPAEPPPVEAEA